MNRVKNNIKILLAFLVVSCVISAQNTDGFPKASFTFDNQIFDYGNIPEDGGLANHTFIIKNAGSDPLVIKQVTASCGCTTPNWSKNPITSGKTGEITVAYNPKGRPGPFSKDISVYCENAAPVHLTIKGNAEKAKEGDKPKEPVFSPVETSYHFGTISENDGYADHIFQFKNTGDAPLIIKRVQASCGCTRPEWTQTPVEPGKEGVIIITFNPKGRIGNFNKSATVYTNEENGFKRHKLIITGNVVEKPSEPPATYTDTIGGIGIERTDLIFDNYYPMKANREFMYIKNYNNETAYLSWENVPEYVTINAPDSLKADWPGEISVIIDGTKTVEKRGRIKDSFKWTVKNKEGRILGSKEMTATANYTDDFSKLSTLQRVNGSRLEIKNTRLLFDNIKRKFLGFGGSISKDFTLTNTGKSDLTLHSISSDDNRVHLSELAGKIIKAGESQTVKVTVKTKELDSAIDTDIYVICSDPIGPTRKIKVSAQKAQ